MHLASRSPPEPPAAVAPAPAALEAMVRVHLYSLEAAAALARAGRPADPRQRLPAERFRAMHQRHAASVAAMLEAAGRPAETTAPPRPRVPEGGSVMDRNRRGEMRLLEAFDTALAADLPCTVLARLRAMRAEVADLVLENRPPG